MKIVTKNIILSENTVIAADGFYGFIIQNLSESLVTVNNSIVLRQYERYDNYQLPVESQYLNDITINSNTQANIKIAVVLYYKNKL